MLDFDEIQVMSFDCYGTLIDWEAGILAALGPELQGKSPGLTDRALLELYGRFEREAQGQTPFVNYRTVLSQVYGKLKGHLILSDNQNGDGVLAGSLPDWLPFPDAPEALKRLKSKFRLAIVSNVDDDLFAHSQRRLGVDFDWVFTSERAHSYKPAAANFQAAWSAMGVRPNQHLHIAQSRYHDIVPAHALGWRTVWLNRQGAASTPEIDCQPDLEIGSLEELARMAISGKSVSPGSDN